MSQLPHARSFRDLIVYQKSKVASKHIFEVTKHFPREEMYSLTDQARRASRSVGAQIAEAWAKRRYEKHFAKSLNSELSEIGCMLNAMIEKASVFCGEPILAVRESAVDYFSTDN